LWVGTTNPINDNLLQTVDVVTSGIVSSGIELMVITKEFVVMELDGLVAKLWDKSAESEI